MKRIALAGLAAAVLATAGCQGPRSAAGFRLPPGDAQRGQAAFLELKCNECHRVAGLELPGPVADPPGPVILGGMVNRVKTDGELVSSIINPSHRIVDGYPRALVRNGPDSRMPVYGETMSVRQMTDLVAFLQSHYEYVAPVGDGAY
jgi:L-cysteine S-thiosulfotransferase